MSEEEFLTDHADYLGNAEISKVAKELQSESYTAMASKSKFDDMAAALISQLEAGTPNVKAIFEHFTGVSYSEDKLNMEMARELLQSMQEEDWNRRYDSLADLLKVINGFFGEARISVKALNWTGEPVISLPGQFPQVFKWSGRCQQTE